MTIQIIPVRIDKEIEKCENIPDLIFLQSEIKDGDILVVTQKIISKQEGNIVNLSKIKPSLLATGIASAYGKDPRVVQLVRDQTKRIVRMNNGIIISETSHGLVCLPR